MKVVHVTRTPLGGTVAKNALQWGTGGLDIDESRVSFQGEADQWKPASAPSLIYGGYMDGSGQKYKASHHEPTALNAEPHAKGRWPANLILQHRTTCRRVGNTSSEVWGCGDGCPAAALDGQSGSLRARGNLGTSKGGGGLYGHGPCTNDFGAGDVGGAARFFKQVQEQATMNMLDELQTYLCGMIGTPEARGLYVSDLSAFDPSIHADSSLPGLLVEGQPDDAMAAELMRILMPGAYLLLVAPDDEPTGHTGACIIEDGGFEIRDAILWAREGEKLHYVPKAARREREAGCEHLPGRGRAELTGRTPGSAGLVGSDGSGNPYTGANWKTPIKNFHPTVKPIALMERLLSDVPKDQGPVLDPFMGSGTTGIAAANTGHDFIGIEMDEEYLEIADTRIRHWDNQKPFGRKLAVVVSDHERPPEEKAEPMGLDVFFGFGED